MAKKQLAGMVEQIALDFVMMDGVDTTALVGIKTLFENACQLAAEISEKEVERIVQQATSTMDKIINGQSNDPQQDMNGLARIISGLQLIVIDGRDIDDSSIPEEIHEILSSSETEDAEESEDGQISGRKLRHPETLPSYLDENTFAEFLSCQDSVLVSMEGLIIDLEKGEDASKIDELKRLLHTLKGEAGFLSLSDVERLCHRTEDALVHFDSGLTDILFSVKDWLSDAFAAYSGAGELPVPVEKLLKELLNYGEKGRGERREDKADAKTGKVDTPVVPAESDQKPVVERRSDQPDRRTGVLDRRAAGTGREKILVDAERLDRLIDAIGELSIATTTVCQSDEASRNVSSGYARSLRQLEKVTRELQQMGLSLRMVPIRALFQKMGRMVRDLAKKTGKKVSYEMTGEETELDKTLVDKIADPLLHMVRNAVDHGIEKDAATRISADKPETGHIKIAAYHQGGGIFIEIEDDGRGLDPVAIRKKAQQTGLMSPDSNPSHQEILNLIFHPGFSMAERVTDISGRGVGMDVVRRNIEGLRGQVDIRSEMGRGTTFVIRIPLTLAIIDGLLVRVNDDRYILPAQSVVSTTKVGREAVSSMHGRHRMMKYQEKLLPVFFIENLFDPENLPDVENEVLLVIVEEGERQIALVVDELIGKQQTVIKSLGEALESIDGLSGAAVMPDGRLGLILDPAGLFRLVDQDRSAVVCSGKVSARSDR